MIRTKRFVLYLVLVPIVGPLVMGALRALIYGGNPFSLVLRLPGFFLWTAYINWLLPALIIAIADRFLWFDKVRRLGTIAAVGCVSTLATVVALYGQFPSGSGMLLPGLVGAIAAPVCCLLLDHLNKERLGKLGSMLHDTIRALRRWPNRAEE